MRAAAALLLVAASLAVATATQAIDRAVVGERFRTLTRDSAWTPVAQVPLKFTTHHPQGMIKLGDTLFLSSVEIKLRTTRFASPKDGYDRDTGAGVGHLFKVDLRPGSAGGLLSSPTRSLAKARCITRAALISMAHTSGCPSPNTGLNSRLIVYSDRSCCRAQATVFRFADHLGGIIRNPDDNTLHAVSWGSRWFYRFVLDFANMRVTDADASPANLIERRIDRTTSTTRIASMPARGGMVCGGISELRPAGASVLRLGGLDLIDLADGRPLHQVPVPLWTPGGLPMTRNPVWIEPAPAGLRAYFLPDDDASTLYVYEVR